MISFLHIPARHQLTSSGAVRWGWPGGYAEFRFDGPGFALECSGKQVSLRVTIDHESYEYPSLGAGITPLSWDHLAPGSHLVRIQTLHQEIDRPLTLQRILFPGDSHLETYQPSRPMIEFVGDSWTSGYGNLSATELFSDCSRSFAGLLATRLDCDYSLIAASGHGLVKNYGDTPPSRETLLHRYSRELPENQSSQELASGRQADLVVVLVGENDFSFEPWPSTQAFIQNAHELLKRVRLRHGDPQILLLTVDRGHPTSQLIEQVFAEEQEQHPGRMGLAHFQNLDPALPLGYNWHPSLLHHQKIATELLPYISQRIAVTPRG